MAPGSYSPEGDFSDFEGSSANGIWTLTITDNLSIDNGFICGWDIKIKSNSLLNCNENQGCTNELACNYDNSAVIDNGTCILQYLPSRIYKWNTSV